ncbi:hypothetical protein SPRG_02890 [Saprolegnia parasitica CBS 223.65]|uniref:Aldehyde dehydrogenase domain-containing protein n=1 Tax=Saprolegnia parasitica (strain CBS 223.65) TaxID=695850 RepID=A0A067CPH6_SAPPC|nr:hypothetical protein SPRG_02890 [Saprolegnia parasitica CBS 223.65]KDO32413.1 hypothetical protein SPRG_02890 [Saprolegnia parasitica CBS 223.65]|eukprot:XP_012196867.1 hypothetical protein SPRG_02890 [Saprolegnia parasitica CBS 223.65]
MAALEASALMDDELFGPLLAITSSDMDSETIRSTPKPLALYVILAATKTVSKWHCDTRRLAVSSTHVMQMDNLNLPFGNSGLGTYTKSVLRTYFWLDWPPRYMPYTCVLAVMTPLRPVLLRWSIAFLAVLSLAWLLCRPCVRTLVTRRLQVLREA